MPDAQDNDLIVERLFPATGIPATIWLSKTTMGGLEIVELPPTRHYAEDPRRFWSLVAGEQQPNDYGAPTWRYHRAAPARRAGGHPQDPRRLRMAELRRHPPARRYA